MSSSSQDQQPTVSGPIQSQLHLTQQMTTYWPQFKVSRQRYAGTLFEEQSMLHMPQKHKDTVQDSTLCMEMNALESKLTMTKPASSIGSPSHGSGPSGPRQTMMEQIKDIIILGAAVVGDVCLHDLGFGGACTRLPPPLQPTHASPVRL